MKNNVSLANLTSIHVGGKARYFAVAKNIGQLKQALALAREKGWPVYILGGGTNLVFPDKGWPGLVLKIGLRGKKFVRRGNQPHRRAGKIFAEVAAGENWDLFVRFCVQKNYAGVECLSGIPGLVGGTPIQNVGAYGQEVAETIINVKCLDRRTLRVVEFKNTDCDFSYRSSRFKTRDKDKYIILSVLFRLIPGGAPTLKYQELKNIFSRLTGLRARGGVPVPLQDVRRAVLALRRKKSMLLRRGDPNCRSCGSFFTNPIISASQFKKLARRFPQIPNFPAEKINPVRNSISNGVKLPAAWLVENAGFYKGYKFGQVGISTNHSLAIINRGRGTATEIVALAGKIKKAVKKKFNLALEPEPNIVSPRRP